MIKNLQKNKEKSWISCGYHKVYIQKITPSGKKYWYDLYANKKVPKRIIEKELNKKEVI